MNNSQTSFEFFRPIDEIAKTIIQSLEEISDQKVREYRRQILSAYESAKEINPKSRDWKKILTTELNPSIKAAGVPQFSEFDSEIFPGGSDQFAGVAELEEGHVKFWVRKNLKTKGVRLCNVDYAISQSLIKPDLLPRQPHNGHEDRFSLLSRGASKHSTCLMIPENLNIEKPFLIKITTNQFPVFFPVFILVKLGNSSRIKIILELNSGKKNREVSVLPFSIITLLADAAELDIIERQDLGDKVLYFPNQDFRIGSDASLNQVIIDRGSEIVRRVVSVNLDEAGAKANVTGVYLPTKTQKFIYDTRQNHMASNTTSDLLFKGVLDSSAYSLWKGNVYVAGGTAGADGYQMNNNLLLKSSAHAESIPGLEIVADDVRCSHGVTLSNVDQDQLFYLESRGIKNTDGTRLIVDGFIKSGLQRIRAADIKEYARNNLRLIDEF